MPIRKAIHADIDALERLWREMMQFHWERDPYFTIAEDAEVNHRLYMESLIEGEDTLVLVCEDDGEVLGNIIAHIRAYPPIYLHKKFVEISEISVTASQRRNGLGGRLLEHILDWAREQGIKRVECMVALENPVSQGFWKGNGFRAVTETCVLELE